MCECLYGDGKRLSIILHFYAFLQTTGAWPEREAGTAVFILDVSFAPHPSVLRYIRILIGADECIVRCAVSCGERYMFVLSLCEMVVEVVRYKIWLVC